MKCTKRFSRGIKALSNCIHFLPPVHLTVLPNPISSSSSNKQLWVEKSCKMWGLLGINSHRRRMQSMRHSDRQLYSHGLKIFRLLDLRFFHAFLLFTPHSPTAPCMCMDSRILISSGLHVSKWHIFLCLQPTF